MNTGQRLNAPYGLLPGKLRGGKAYRQKGPYKQAILQRDGHRCQTCGCGVGEATCGRHAPVSQLDVAHRVPFKDGGLSTPDNQRVLCHSCNQMERDLSRSPRRSMTLEQLLHWCKEQHA